MLTGFVAVFFPFRTLTRGLWLVLSPLSVWFAVLLGLIVFVRLNTAPAYEHTSYHSGGFVSQIVPATIFVYLLPILVWISIYQAGWRLRQKGQTISSRTTQLKELLALMGVVGAITVLAQNSVPPEQVIKGKELFGSHRQVLIILAALESFFLVPVILASFSRSHVVAIAACLLYVAISMAADRYHQFSGAPGNFTAYRDIDRFWAFVGYIALPFRGYRIIGSIAFTFVVMMSRGSGFRLVRDADQFEKVDETMIEDLA